MVSFNPSNSPGGRCHHYLIYRREMGPREMQPPSQGHEQGIERSGLREIAGLHDPFHPLSQGSVKDRPGWVECGPVPVFVNKVLLERVLLFIYLLVCIHLSIHLHTKPCSFIYCLCTTIAVRVTKTKTTEATSLKYVPSVPLQKVCIPMPGQLPLPGRWDLYLDEMREGQHGETKGKPSCRPTD